MKYLIVCAGKYGSTLQTGRWIGERLEGEVHVTEAREMADPGERDVVILGSGIYSHTVLSDIMKYVDKYRETLAGKKTAVFGVAIDTTGVFVKGKVHGGWSYILPLIEKLPSPPVYAGLLGGEINPMKLDDGDRKKLERFYKMMDMGDGIPFKTRMTKQAAWEFAEKLMNRLNSDWGHP